jgi:hypothetical protein
MKKESKKAPIPFGIEHLVEMSPSETQTTNGGRHHRHHHHHTYHTMMASFINPTTGQVTGDQ